MLPVPGDRQYEQFRKARIRAARRQSGAGGYSILPGLGIVIDHSRPPTESSASEGVGDSDVEHKTAVEFARKGVAGRPSRIRDTEDEDGDPRQQRPTRSTPGFGKATVEADR